MNPFMALGALLGIGASLWALWHQDWYMATGYFAWAVADVAFGLKG